MDELMKWLWVITLFVMSAALGAFLVPHSPFRRQVGPMVIPCAAMALLAALTLGEAPRPILLAAALLAVISGLVGAILLVRFVERARSTSTSDRDAA